MLNLWLIWGYGADRSAMLSKISLPLGHQMTDNAAMEKYLLSPASDILKILITDLDTEGRYLFLNAIAAKLRYPHIFLFLWSSVSVCGNRSGENSFPMVFADETTEHMRDKMGHKFGKFPLAVNIHRHHIAY